MEEHLPVGKGRESGMRRREMDAIGTVLGRKGALGIELVDHGSSEDDDAVEVDWAFSGCFVPKS